MIDVSQGKAAGEVVAGSKSRLDARLDQWAGQARPHHCR